MEKHHLAVCRDCRRVKVIHENERADWLKRHRNHRGDILHNLDFHDLRVAEEEIRDVLTGGQKEMVIE